jgi:hypothetical protein
MCMPVKRKGQSSEGLSTKTPRVQKLDGKTQPIGQYKLISKKAGKNTEEIKQGWHDSITIAHNMLVEVNQELEKILDELNEISKALNKLNKKLGANDAVKRFETCREHIKNATSTSDRLRQEFNKYVPRYIKFAAATIKDFTAEDFEKLKKGLNKKEVEKLKEIFDRIKLLEQNINLNSHDVSQAADAAKRNKSHQIQRNQGSVSKSEGGESSSRVSYRSDESSLDDPDFSESPNVPKNNIISAHNYDESSYADD